MSTPPEPPERVPLAPVVPGPPPRAWAPLRAATLGALIRYAAVGIDPGHPDLRLTGKAHLILTAGGYEVTGENIRWMENEIIRAAENR